MSPHKIRSIIAAAALAAGVSWLAAAPADAGACGKKHAAGKTACEEPAAPRPNDAPPGSREITPEAVDLTMAAGRLARDIGLIGLASTRPVPGLLDLGGIAATWGMPSLASASPGLSLRPEPVGMEDLATEAHVPDLPALPIPGNSLQEQAPRDTTLGRGPFLYGVSATGDEDYDKSDAIGKSGGGVEKPVGEIGSRVIGEVLPKAMEGTDGSSVPGPAGGNSGVEGLAGLVKGFGLR